MDDDGDDDESEVELDSLGSFFVHLIDNDCYQEEAEASRAGDEEVIVLSSGSESVPKQRTRQARQKSKVFSSFGLFGSQLYLAEAAT